MNHPQSPPAPGDLALRRRTPAVRRFGAVAALALTVGLAGVACSKTDQTSTAASTAAPATSKPAADSGSATTVGTRPGTTPGSLRTTTTSGDLSPGTTADTGSSGTGPSTTNTTVPGTPADAAFCAKGAEMSTKLAGMQPTDPTALTQYKAIFADLAAVAPPEVQADMTQINTIIQGMTSLDAAPPNADQLDAAGKRVDAWAVAHCGKKFGTA